ncbi:DJ-1/PfpI family protein [Nocardiopsis sp. N85]|uniref:DJ-1/PfpI family protein n=1 Tax=Nocardiopsis sp. N85 TaxID=3029400 RepID=UPI00237F64EC|nr:DJ-1/PfpI family protein [Nocardiopsis sp. N85]MDE3721954.1 DJ-1/PfpI family protein [Nocardiopsis sp. N85]
MSSVPRVLVRVLFGCALSLTVFAGLCLGGVTVTMGQSYVDAPHPVESGPPVPRAAPAEGRTVVAVAVGATGSVNADVLPPYEVFARSTEFFVYTVSADPGPVPLSGGVGLLPDHTFDEVASGAAPAPDVVVVPAVVAPTGDAERPLREWIAAQHSRGALLLGICDGSRVLAAAGLLDGRRATAFWAGLGALERDHPRVEWTSGQRYVDDGDIVTTAGVTSGIVGALRLVERIAGADEAERIGADSAYPGWSVGGPTGIPAHRLRPADLPYGLNAAFPWLRPVYGIGLVQGVGETEASAAFEVYSATAFATRTVAVAAEPVITTRHGLRLVARPVDGEVPRLSRLVIPGGDQDAGDREPLLSWAAERGLRPETVRPAAGESAFDPVLRDLAAHTDRATARVTAKFAEYPVEAGGPEGGVWPWRPTVVGVGALVVSAAVGALPILVRSRAGGGAQRGTRALGRPTPGGTDSEETA